MPSPRPSVRSARLSGTNPQIYLRPHPRISEAVQDVLKRRPGHALGQLIHEPALRVVWIAISCTADQVSDLVAILVSQNAKHGDRQFSQILPLVSSLGSQGEGFLLAKVPTCSTR